MAGVEVVPRVVAYVVCAFGPVDSEKIDIAVLVGEGDTDVVAVYGVGPVGDAVGVNLGLSVLYIV